MPTSDTLYSETGFMEASIFTTLYIHTEVTMDYKRNQNYFSPTYAKKMTMLAVIGITLAILGGLLWWYVYLGEVFYYIFEFSAIGGVILTITAFSLRPSEQYLWEQIDQAERRFREEAMETFGYPSDAENCTRLVWGFLDGTAKKTAKDGKTLTDRVEFSMIWIKKGEIRVYQHAISLLEDSTAVSDRRLSKTTLTTTLNRDAHTLTLTDHEETVVLTVHSPDYRLDEFLGSMKRNGR